MKYDNDQYLGDEDDNELWNDELDLNSEEPEAEQGAYSPIAARREDSSWVESDDGSDEDDDRDYDDHDDDAEDYYDEPEPKAVTKPMRERIFGGSGAGDLDNDFYDSDAEPAEQPKKPKIPKLDPEDPDYWIEEETALSSILPKPQKKWKWWLSGIVVLLALICAAWIWFFRPYVDSAVKYGYISNMERRGSIVKTFEGSMIPYKELGDPEPTYFEEIRFSVESDSLAAQMKRMMLACLPVRVEYEVYHTALPWKGEEKMIITKVDSADVNRILPPEYRYFK